MSSGRATHGKTIMHDALFKDEVQQRGRLPVGIDVLRKFKLINRYCVYLDEVRIGYVGRLTSILA